MNKITRFFLYEMNIISQESTTTHVPVRVTHSSTGRSQPVKFPGSETTDKTETGISTEQRVYLGSLSALSSYLKGLARENNDIDFVFLS